MGKSASKLSKNRNITDIFFIRYIYRNYIKISLKDSVNLFKGTHFSFEFGLHMTFLEKIAGDPSLIWISKY